MRITVLQHVLHEDAGLLGRHLGERRIRVATRRLDLGDPVPEALAADEALLVMGGPMGVGDRDAPRLGFLPREIALIRRALAARQRVVGICLGAQLIAHAAGARVFPNRIKEVGMAPVQWRHATGDPLLTGLAAEELVLHWHGDTFDLPAGAVHLAETAACAHQAFRLDRAIGLQFHPEVDADGIRTWLREDAAFVRAANGADGPRLLAAELDCHYAAYRRAGDVLIARLAEALTT